MTTESLKITSDSGPFAIIPEWVIVSRVSHGAVRLYALLARYADWETGEAWPSRRTLADALLVSTDTVDRWVKELESIQALRVCRRMDQEAVGQPINLTNLYTVIRVRDRGGRTDTQDGRIIAPRGGRKSAARGGGRDAALSIPNYEQDLIELETPVRNVFLTWCEHAKKDPVRTKLDAKRTRAIKWALANYSLEDVLLAVEGWRYSPFHSGQNKHNRTYNELTLLLRDSTKLEMFRDLARNPKSAIQAPETWSRLEKYLEGE